ncbi:MAG: hypothetical protein MZU95_04460 [Desulfomicrobium escambiense]|nr:hypothetical protein [Desulfomicrobium escambiense]
MKSVIQDENSDIQLFSAKAHSISLYVNYMIDKYNNKTERHYESYKQILSLNKNLLEAADYWRYTSKYNRLIRGSVMDKSNDEKLMRQKLSAALQSLDTTIEILKENSAF